MARASGSRWTSCACTVPTTRCCPRRAAEDPRRFTADRVWIIDPLDGTNEFGETRSHATGRCTSRCGSGGGFGAAAVSLPAHGITFCHRPAPTHAARSPAATAADHVAQPRAVRGCARGQRARLRCGPPRLGRRQGDGGRARRGRHLRPRRRHVPVGLGGARRPSPWPPACTPAASTASPLVYNDRDPWLPDFLICRPELADSVLAAIWGLSRRTRPDWQGRRPGPDGDPFRGRRPRRHGVAAPPAPAQRVDRPDARRVPLGAGTIWTRDPTCAPSSSPARRRRSASAATATRWPGTPTRGSYDDGLPGDAGHGPATACGPSSTRTSRSSSRCGSRSSPRSTAPRAGVGLAVALFCDLRFGSAPAKMHHGGARSSGLPAEYGMSWMLPRLVGVTRATDLLLSGRVVHRRRDRRLGPVERRRSPTATPTLARRREYADVARHHGRAERGRARPSARSTTTCCATTSAHRSPKRSRLLGEAMGTAEYREGVAALRERRPPKF